MISDLFGKISINNSAVEMVLVKNLVLIVFAKNDWKTMACTE